MSPQPRYHYKSIFAVEGGAFIADRVSPFPLTVGPAEMLEYLVDLHGAPSDVAVHDTAEFGRVKVGWVFAGPTDDERTPLELIVIPMIEDLDDADQLISMFVYQEQLRRDFVSTMTDAGIEVEIVQAGNQEDSMSTSTSMWAQNGLHVDVSLIDDGSLRFMGQDLKTFGDDEYEYALTVAPDDIVKVTAALGAEPGDDVISLLVANAENIIRTGERTWLHSLGIEPDFWSRIG